MKRLLTTIIAATTLFAYTHAQYKDTTKSDSGIHEWENQIGNMLEEDDDEAADWEATYDALCELENNPVDINNATKEDMERIPFLSDNEIADILEYIYRNGAMKTAAELSMIKSLSARKCRLLQYFIHVESCERKNFPTLRDILRYGKNEFLVTGNIPLYEREGDKKGYLGYKYKHSIRYEHSYGEYLRIGLVGAQDAGEPFFAGRNSAGYDFYSFYLSIRKLGILNALTVGRYRIRFGMGLTINNDLSLGKAMSLSSIERQGSTIRPHSSRTGYNYMQGAAATVRLLPMVTLTAFVSYRDIDATLNNDDGTIATILKSGYHRTEAEMKKKNNSSQLAAGGNITFSSHGFSLGLSGYYATLNRELKPNKTAAYRKYYADGKHFYNASVDYGYRNGKFSFRGETATGGCKAIATINTISYRLRSNFSLMALQRYYDYKYFSLFAQSFSDGGRVQNESGVYLGANWLPVRKLSITYYTDIAYFPWARYQAKSSSKSFDNMLSATFSATSWTISARYRLKIQQKDNADKTGLMNKTDHRGRISAAYTAPLWSFKAQVDATRSTYKETSTGYMATIAAGCKAIKKLQIYTGFGYFHTQDYNSRIYSYERGMLYDFSFPAYYGEGIRYSLLAVCKPADCLTLTAKAAVTDYFDRDHIGTALQQISHSSMSDISLQLRWTF